MNTCLRCGFKGPQTEFQEPPMFSPQFLICKCCGTDVAAQARLSIMNGDVKLIQRMIDTLSLRLKGAENAS